MRYEVWILDNANKQVIMKNYANYKSAKSVAKLFAKQHDILKVWIYASEHVKDEEPDLL